MPIVIDEDGAVFLSAAGTLYLDGAATWAAKAELAAPGTLYLDGLATATALVALSAGDTLNLDAIAVGAALVLTGNSASGDLEINAFAEVVGIASLTAGGTVDLPTGATGYNDASTLGAPTGVSVSIVGTTATLTGTYAPGATGLAGFRTYLDGVPYSLASPGSSFSIPITLPTAGLRYTFHVAAEAPSGAQGALVEVSGGGVTRAPFG